MGLFGTVSQVGFVWYFPRGYTGIMEFLGRKTTEVKRHSHHISNMHAINMTFKFLRFFKITNLTIKNWYRG